MILLPGQRHGIGAARSDEGELRHNVEAMLYARTMYSITLGQDTSPYVHV